MSGSLSQPPMDGAREHRLHQKIAFLKSAVVSILSRTEWPGESKAAATSLLNTVKALPDIPNTTTSSSEKLQSLTEQYIQVLEDVCARLKDASSKTGMEKWKFLQQIKSLASNRPSKCALVLKTCQADVSESVNALEEYFNQEREVGLETARALPEVQTRVALPGTEGLHTSAPNLQMNPSQSTAALEHSPFHTSLNRTSDSGAPKGQKSAGPIHSEALGVARKIFNGVEIVSGSIPVVGSYVGAVAKVGLAFVQTLETMDKNDNLAEDLGTQTAKLSGLLEGFLKKPNSDQGKDIADYVNDLHR
ncbi:hypothetical protein FS837_009781, partial [Tulasnella sp. UAMH 9824]